MFSNIFVFLAVASTVFAHPAIAPRGGSCSSNTAACCDSVQNTASSPSDKSIGGLIPIDLQSLNVPLGINCVPINVIGIGNAGSCTVANTCCDGVDNSGTVPIGVNCNTIPVNV